MAATARQGFLATLHGWFASSFWRRPAVLFAVGAALFLNLGTWVALAVALPRSPFPFTLHYTAALGADFFGTRSQLFIVPGIGFLLLGLNILLAAWLWNRERALAAFVLGLTPFVQIGLAAGSVFLILANA
ncbi:hypothetical protein HYZ80_01455 [Candidatus Parcubacteria bacterium]|nr:hypothetical protein [Candidatus Parcubacteria bacterium]